MKAWFTLFLLSFSLVPAALAACAFSGGDASDTVGAGGSATGGGGAMAPTVGSGGQCPVGCSADLKRVVDCNGETVTTCPVDDVCINGSCVANPWCAAAAEARGSIGCDFWAVKPDTIIAEAADFACFAMLIANTWDSPVHIDASHDGVAFTDFIYIPEGQGADLSYTAYDPDVGLGVGEVAVLFLSDDKDQQYFMPSCPESSGMTDDPAIHGTGIGKAIRVHADRPISAYSIFPYGGGSAAVTSATMLLPTPVWDTNYIGINAYERSQLDPPPLEPGVPSMAIVADQDNTTVTILPKFDIEGGGGIPATAANTAVSITIDTGEYIQLTQAQELTGSVIEADKPVGLWGGATCLNVPADVGTCDSAHQQIAPVGALGHEYVGVRHRDRATANVDEESPPWRLVGAVDGTELTWQPSAPPGAPTTLGLGELAEFSHPGPFTVSSQDGDHPFYAAQYMTGCTLYQTSSEGDPDWVNIVPTAQFLDRYVFFADPTYPETNFVVVRKRSQRTSQFADVTLECAGVLDGWQAVGDYEYTRVDIVTGNFESVGACSAGRHEMTSDAPFSVTVWGWGSNQTTPTSPAVSYAYTAGASIATINDVEVPAVPK